VTTGTVAALQESGTSVRTEATRPLTQLLRAAGATVHTGTEGELVVRGIGITEIGDRACAAGIALHELSPQAGSLEELFLAWTSSDSTLITGTEGNPHSATTPSTTVPTQPERQVVPS
jgi:ABC-2 type transport system ATP-binding protein